MRRLFARVRFLPLTIFFASMMLTVRIGDIWKGLDDLTDSGIEVSEAQAQTQPEQPAAPPAAEGGEQAAAPADGAPQEGKPEGLGEAEAEAQAEGEGDPEEKTAADRLIIDDPTLLSPAEIEILQRLAERRDQLLKRERELDMREGLLGAAEQRIERKVAELKNLEATITSLIKTFDEQQERKMQSLVKIYESMKPKEAARIFEDLEMDTLLEVAERMKERKLAPVMAKMNPEKAREITVQLRELRQLPDTGARFGG